MEQSLNILNIEGEPVYSGSYLRMPHLISKEVFLHTGASIIRTSPTASKLSVKIGFRMFG